MSTTLETIMDIVETADTVDVAKQLDNIEITDENRMDVGYVRGRLAEREFDYEKAVELYDNNLEEYPDHQETLFRLAYLLDLRGEEERAIELYEQFAAIAPTPVNALINLAVLYEDKGQYNKAETCLDRILEEFPNHKRAKLFLRDVEAAQEMYYDEEIERKQQARNAVLDISVTDFELSVRSRNCLKQMNIHTLGDLLKISEAELLAYKNFGETSLNEIKAMLSQKGLRIGQLLEEDAGDLSSLTSLLPKSEAATTNGGDPDFFSRSVAEIELSARSRKCLQRLNIQTIGDLISRSEQELLSAKNFGVTSLDEIKHRLGEMGLSLR